MNKLIKMAFSLMAGGAILLTTGCSTSTYLDPKTKEIPVSEMKPVAAPKPAQLAFEFQTNGIPNAAGTNYIKEKILEQVRASKLFSEVEVTPVENGGLLSIKLNNIAATDEAMKKGVLTGITFGAAGSEVVDAYVCTLSYLPAGQSKPIVETAQHALHTTIGSTEAPKGMIKVNDTTEGVLTMTRQIISNVLNDLSRNEAFNP